MTARRKKKARKFRGSKTHGWGSKKKHRGAGNRGGRGLAGTGKRADQKKPSILKEYGNEYFGRRGFVSPQRKEEKTINLDYLEKNAEKLKEKGLIKKENEHYIIDIRALGFDKLLGKGKIKNKYKVKGKTSKTAEEKIKEAGGEAKQ